MDTIPLDIEGLERISSEDWQGFPTDTKLGHMHLTVVSLDPSQTFYESLGLRLTANWGTFRFLSWDNYHHHVAINLLAGRSAAPITPEISGLSSFSIQRGSLPAPLLDPSGILLTPPLKL
jgi:catechol 2,3-dioxygenase